MKDLYSVAGIKNAVTWIKKCHYSWVKIRGNSMVLVQLHECVVKRWEFDRAADWMRVYAGSRGAAWRGLHITALYIVKARHQT